jgi:hypothetical protein
MQTHPAQLIHKNFKELIFKLGMLVGGRNRRSLRRVLLYQVLDLGVVDIIWAHTPVSTSLRVDREGDKTHMAAILELSAGQGCRRTSWMVSIGGAGAGTRVKDNGGDVNRREVEVELEVMSMQAGLSARASSESEAEEAELEDREIPSFLYATGPR